MKYAFNTLLLLYLSKILHVKQIDLCATYGGNPSTYVYRVQNCTFPLGDLICICNEYHVPISWFIVPENKLIIAKEQLPTKEELVWKGEWKPIENLFGNFGVQFAKAKNVGYESASKLCGIAVSSYYNLWINDEKRWRKVNMYNGLRIFNNTKIYPGIYVKDDNRPIKMIEGFADNGYNKSDENDAVMNEHYFKKLVASNNRLRAEVKQMREEMDRMKEELRALRGDSSVHRAAEDGN